MIINFEFSKAYSDQCKNSEDQENVIEVKIIMIVMVITTVIMRFQIKMLMMILIMNGGMEPGDWNFIF